MRNRKTQEQLTLDGIVNVGVVTEERAIETLKQHDLELYIAATSWTVPVLKSYVDFFEDALMEIWNGRKHENVRDLKHDGKGGLEFKIGNVQFWMKKPAASPSYAEMNRGLLRYLANMLEEWGAGKRVEGVLEIDGKIYLSVEDVYRKFRDVEIFFRGEKNPEIKYNEPDYDIEDVFAILNFPLNEYGKLMQETARKYRIAKEQLKLIEKNIVERVREITKAEMVYDKNNLPDTTVVDGFTIGRFLVMDMMSPRDSVKYKGIFEGIKGYVAEGEQITIAEGKGYDIFRIRDGIVYAEIAGIAKKFMDGMRDPELSGSTLQHRILVLPKPKYDWVAVN